MATFPKDFIWGAATSSYQIEGATNGRLQIYLENIVLV
jgi:beta-glucosidase/6-phospho-beta-glucosidase/beta-galactosidase